MSEEIIIILLIAITIFYYDKNSTEPKINQSSIKNIYLYHNDNVGKITPDISSYDSLLNEILDIINNPDMCRGTIDGLMIFNGNGTPMDMDIGKYFVEINFVEPTKLTLVGKTYTDICTILISLDDNCLYIYNTSEREKGVISIAGYGCTDQILDKLNSFVIEYFNKE